MQIFVIHEVSSRRFCSLISLLFCRVAKTFTHFATSTLLFSLATNVFATDSQQLTRIRSRQANELLIRDDHHDSNDLYLIIKDGSQLSTDRLAALKRLRGLKIERLGRQERIPGVYWFGGIGQSPQLRSFCLFLETCTRQLSIQGETQL